MDSRWLMSLVTALGCSSCSTDDNGGCPPGTIPRGGLCVPSGADADAQVDSDTEAGADSDSDSDSDANADAGADADVDADAGPDADADSGVVCSGAHPKVADLNDDGDFADEGERTCGPGDTYCSLEDACYADATAEPCCAIDACDGTHPLIDDLNGDGDFADEGERTCAEPDTYCVIGDVCFSDAKAIACCG